MDEQQVVLGAACSDWMKSLPFLILVQKTSPRKQAHSPILHGTYTLSPLQLILSCPGPHKSPVNTGELVE